MDLESLHIDDLEILAARVAAEIRRRRKAPAAKPAETTREDVSAALNSQAARAARK